MTLPVEVNPTLLSGGGYNLQRSLRFRSSASAYLNRTPGSSTNSQTWTYSVWFKRGTLGTSQQLFSTPYNSVFVNSTYIGFASDSLSFATSTLSTTVFALGTTQLFRDPSSWYHVVAVCDTTNATSTDRVRLYVNGVRVTAFSTANYPAQNATTYVNTTVAHQIGRLLYDASTIQLFDGYMAEINFIDGQALTPSSFGATNPATGVWQPAKYTGTYGTNGFYLPFTDNSGATSTTIGRDFSGNSNNWTPNNISVTAGVTYDSMTDVPTLTSATVANFPVMNPLDKDTARGTLDNANLRLYYPTYSSQNSAAVRGTMGVTSGKWYFESQTQTWAGIGNNSSVAFTTSTQNLTGVGINYGTALSNYIGCQADIAGNAVTFVTSGYSASLASATTLFASYASNDVINVAIDFDNGKIWIGKNGTWYNSGNPATATNPTSTFTSPSGTNLPYFEAFTNLANTNQSAVYPNFGQRPFSYTPPSGYVALNTFNLSTPTIAAGNKYMNATLYTGTGASLSVTNSGSMKPDLVWIKSRSAATDHKWTDSNRGTTKALISNTTGAETTDTNGLTAFNSNGFTVGSDTTYNNSGATYVGWQWQAGQGTNVSNTSGSITSTVSASTTAGFSVVTYTGNGSAATVGHGLGVTPSMLIIKCRSTGGSAKPWIVYHSSLSSPSTSYLLLNTTDSVLTQAGLWNGGPTSSIFGVGNFTSMNTSSDTYVAYCFAPIAGFSAFGSYTGNGSTDGPFIYTGFRPRWIMIKQTNVSGSYWLIRDSSRSPNNVVNLDLYPNAADAENTSTANDTDLLSNGFKLRNTGGGSNTSGGTYIYAAFAENPFKYSLAR